MKDLFHIQAILQYNLHFFRSPSFSFAYSPSEDRRQYSGHLINLKGKTLYTVQNAFLEGLRFMLVGVQKTDELA
jgi:hypothetical protein